MNIKMGRIPIIIEKIKTINHNQYSISGEKEDSTETIQYLIKIVEKGHLWDKTF